MDSLGGGLSATSVNNTNPIRSSLHCTWVAGRPLCKELPCVATVCKGSLQQIQLGYRDFQRLLHAPAARGVSTGTAPVIARRVLSIQAQESARKCERVYVSQHTCSMPSDERERSERVDQVGCRHLRMHVHVRSEVPDSVNRLVAGTMQGLEHDVQEYLAQDKNVPRKDPTVGLCLGPCGFPS